MENVGSISDYSVSLGLGAVLLVILLWYYTKLTKPYSGIPTYPALFYFVQPFLKGNFSNELPLSAQILQFAYGITKLFEDDGQELNMVWWGLEPVIVLNSAESVKFFITNPASMEKSPLYDVMKFIAGTGLVTSNSKIWAQHRKIINPTFHRKMHKSYVGVFNRKAKQLIQTLKKEIDKPWIEINKPVKFCTFQILCETVLGVKDDSVVHEVSIDSYFQSIAMILDFLVNRIVSPWLRYDWMLRFSPYGRKHLHIFNSTLLAFTREVIKGMMESTEIPTTTEKEDFDFVADKCKPFVRTFVEAHLKDPEAFTLQDIEYELTTFMIAGYDTTGQAVTSVLYLLGLHPEIQERAFDEISRYTDEDVSYEMTSELYYLDSIIKESLRLLPPIPIFARYLSKTVQYGKYSVPKGAHLGFFPYHYHRNPETFPNPEIFDPGRFSLDEKNEYRYTFMPFAEGPRYCISRTLVIIEMKVILGHILRNFKIVSLDPRDKVNYKWNIIMTPVDPTKIRLIPRDTGGVYDVD